MIAAWVLIESVLGFRGRLNVKKMVSQKRWSTGILFWKRIREWQSLCLSLRTLKETHAGSRREELSFNPYIIQEYVF